MTRAVIAPIFHLSASKGNIYITVRERETQIRHWKIWKNNKQIQRVETGWGREYLIPRHQCASGTDTFESEYARYHYWITWETDVVFLQATFLQGNFSSGLPGRDVTLEFHSFLQHKILGIDEDNNYKKHWLIKWSGFVMYLMAIALQDCLERTLYLNLISFSNARMVTSRQYYKTTLIDYVV